MNFNQGIPGIPTLINSSAVLVTGNAASANALTVRQFGTGNVFVTSNSGGTVGLFVNAQSNVGIGTTNPGYILDMYGSGDQKQTGWASINATSMGGRPLNINYFGPGGGQHISAYALSGATTGGDSTVFYRYVGWIKGDTDSGNLGGFHMEGVIGGGLAETSYLTVDFTNRGTTGGYKYATLTGGTISSSMNVFMVSNTSVSPTTYDLYIKYGGSNYHGFNLDIKSFWNTFRFVNIEGTADPRTAPTSYATSWDILASANFVQKSATGRVGIGTVSPATTLDVRGTYQQIGGSMTVTNSLPSAASSIFLFNDSVNGCGIFLNGVSRSVDGGGGTGTLRNDYGDLRVQAAGGYNNALGITIKGTSGYVGIGSSIPHALLTFDSTSANKVICISGVAGTNPATATDFNGFGVNSSVNLRYQSASAASGGHVWYMGATEAMRIGVTAGNLCVGIGTASPRTILDVNGDSGITVSSTNGAQTITHIYTGFTTNGGGYNGFTTGASSVVSFRAGANGGVTLLNAAAAWSTLSDYRLKNIIEPVSNAIIKVEKIKPIIYTFKSDSSNVRRVGFIAQDVLEIQPEAVSEDASGMLSVRYTELIPLAFAAIKELSTEHTQLKMQMTLLEARLAALESKLAA